MLSFLYEIFKIILLLLLPFIMLIRGAVYLHEHYGLGAWPSTLGGIGLSAFLLFVYFTFFYGRITGSFGGVQSIKRRAIIAIMVVLVYSLQGILFLSNANLKNTALRSEIRNVHPIIRLAVSTLIFVDSDLLITDASRKPEDYQKMGLKTKAHSLHYKQSDGYTHALDLRTNNRSEIRNKLLSGYFKLMGFNTLRHVGTADHLHISLLSHDRPGAI